MAFEIIVTKYPPSPIDPSRHHIGVEYSDVLSGVPEYFLVAVISKIADKFVEEHYAEIEKLLDHKLVAACVTAQLGEKIEAKMLGEVRRVSEVAEQALRRAKRR